jgi:hypothetical protein
MLAEMKLIKVFIDRQDEQDKIRKEKPYPEYPFYRLHVIRCFANSSL